MIGYWHHHVVCLSVCNAVHHGSQSWCTGLKVVLGVSSRQVPICRYYFLHSDTFPVVLFSHKMHRKYESKKTRT